MKPNEKKPRKPHAALLPLASRIRHYRMKGKFTQTDMAEVLDISQPAYEKKEAGFVRFKREELEMLADFFQIHIWELFWDQSQQKNFAAFAKEKGYVPKTWCEMAMELLHAKIRTMKKEISHLKNLNANLEKDKKFLRGMLRNTDNNKLTNMVGGVTS